MLTRRLGLALVIVTIVAGAVGTQWPFAYRVDSFALHRHWQRIEWSWFPRMPNGRINVDDLVLNLVMLIPVGVGWAFWRRGARPLRVLVEATLLGAVVSTSYEAAQLLTRHRYTQFADVWRNTVSCAVGCLVGLAAIALLDRGRRRLLATDAQRHDR